MNNQTMNNQTMNNQIKPGKNFSTNNATGKRHESDFYETPYSLTRLLLNAIPKPAGSVLEPAAGNGAICKVLDEYGIPHYRSDINSFPHFVDNDFLKLNQHFDFIITNPPYSLAFEFIQKAKDISNEFYFLLPLSYLHGKKRYDEIYSDKFYPLRNIYIFTRYPLLGEPLREDGKHNTEV